MRPKEAGMRLFMLALVVALVAAGCGGSSDDASSSLQAGIYTYELTEDYLVENGISAEQAANESGEHQAILREDGAFTDSWTTTSGSSGSCSGTYEEADGNRVTFKWSTGCFGDWEMTYAVDGDTVTWSDHEALAPASEEDQKVTEVFNSVPWTRVGDAS
jgi:hypothetical protein